MQQKLDSLRHRIDGSEAAGPQLSGEHQGASGGLNWFDAWKDFTKLNDQVIDTAQNSLSFTDPQGLLAKRVNGVSTLFVIFVRLKEQIGRERALVGGILASREYGDQHKEQLHRLLAKQEAYENTRQLLMASNSPDGGKKWAEYEAAPCTTEAISARRELDENGLAAAQKMVTADHWYKLMSDRIDLLLETELVLAKDIKQAAIGALKEALKESE